MDKIGINAYKHKIIYKHTLNMFNYMFTYVLTYFIIYYTKLCSDNKEYQNIHIHKI